LIGVGTFGALKPRPTRALLAPYNGAGYAAWRAEDKELPLAMCGMP